MKKTTNLKVLFLLVFTMSVLSPSLAVAEETNEFEDGFNVLIDGYEIMVPAGWSDVEMATNLWAASISDLGITTIKKSVDFGNVWMVDCEEGTYDMMMQCCTPHLVNDPYTVMGGWRGATSRPWNNATWWQDEYAEEFDDLWTNYPNAAPEDRAAIMSEMQEILAREKPSIVSHVNGFWYLTNTKEWENWPSINNEYQDPQTAYSINNYALKQRMYLGLTAAATQTRDTVWNVGYDTFGEDLNPWNAKQSFGIALMYEPLFGRNSSNGVLIPVLGTDLGYMWNEDGSVLTVPVRTDAVWSDGEAIDAEDVAYSYLLAANTTRWSDMEELWDSVNVNGDNVTFTMSSDSNYNFRMEQYLYQDIPIVPEHVWTEITDENDYVLDVTTFDNDWLDSEFPAEWKVCSGPYRPTSRDMTALEAVYEYDPTWWGAGVIHLDIPNYSGVPEATKIGQRRISDNTAKNQAILLGTVDLHAGFYSAVYTALAGNEYLETWFGRSYDQFYLALGAVIEIAPNHLKFPFNQQWFREAIAYSINYDPISLAASGGYWLRARQGIVDDRAATHTAEYNATIQETYGVSYNTTIAESILSEHCFKEDGKWYTKDVPTEFQGTLGAEEDNYGVAEPKGIPGFTPVFLAMAAAATWTVLYRRRK